MSESIEVQNLPVAAIRPGPNDRKTFDASALAELAQSIAEHGLLQPVTVRPLADGSFELVAGERRWRAIRQELKWETIPAIVRDLSDEEASSLMLLENLARADLSPMEEAEAYQSRIDRFGWTVASIARRAGCSPSRVAGRLGLLNLVPELQEMVRKGQMAVAYANLFAKLPADKQRLLIPAAVAGASYSVLAGYVRRFEQEQNQQALFDLGEMLVAQVEKGQAVVNGTAAVVNVPARDDLPAVPARKGIDTGTAIYDWIDLLQAGGFEAEAAVVGTLFRALVHARNISLPPHALGAKE